MKEKKYLPAQPENKNNVQLHNNGLRAGSLIEQSLSRLTEQQAQNLMSKAGEEALRLEVKNREQNMDYVAGKKVMEDHIEVFATLEKGGRTTRQSVTSDIKTGAGNMRIESKSGATCFVASVAYGDPNHPGVMFLRGHRDNILSKSKTGQVFIEWYWVYGPRLANVISKSLILRKVSKMVISRIVKTLQYYEIKRLHF
jgi:hypothetical protein